MFQSSCQSSCQTTPQSALGLVYYSSPLAAAWRCSLSVLTTSWACLLYCAGHYRFCALRSLVRQRPGVFGVKVRWCEHRSVANRVTSGQRLIYGPWRSVQIEKRNRSTTARGHSVASYRRGVLCLARALVLFLAHLQTCGAAASFGAVSFFMPLCCRTACYA